MKKKLEAELISIAHRILKLKNRAELDQLQQETLKLYEKISVLRFVEDNFSDVKPTIGYASAEETLEEIYGMEETPVVHANEQETKEEQEREEKKAQNEEAQVHKPQDKESQATSDEQEEEADGSEQASEQKEDTEGDEPENGEGVTASSTLEEGVSEEEKEKTEESGEDVGEKDRPKAEEPQEETRNAQPATEEAVAEEPEVKVQVEKPAEDVKAMEQAAEAVYKKEDEASAEEEEQAIDAEVITIAPDNKAKVEDFGVNFEFAFERPAAPEEPQKQKEITFEDYKDYEEPEFVKKGDEAKAEELTATSQQPQADEPQDPKPNTQESVRDWRDWEPAKEEEPQATSQQAIAPAQDPKPNTQNLNSNSRALSLGLNDRIAFEKNLFGGSGEDLNRVISQLNTFDTYEHAVEFINDMVKPDYNNWQGKEEYEERFMALVEQKFS
jgi:hypothetical protein